MDDSSVPTPSDRFRIAIEMFEAGVDMMRQNLRREDPDATEEEIEDRLRAWLWHRPGAEFGDSAGRPVPWPRQQR